MKNYLETLNESDTNLNGQSAMMKTPHLTSYDITFQEFSVAKRTIVQNPNEHSHQLFNNQPSVVHS